MSDLSFVVATESGWPVLERTLRAIRAQTIAERIEVVVVSAAPLGDPPAGAADGLADLRVVVSAFGSVAQANAAGVRAASAPVVALGEDHSFPLPGWAEALLDRHAADAVAVVGPVVRNANPGRLVSWADFFIAYGLHWEGVPGGDVAQAPGHNSSYRRDVLLREGDGLAGRLEAEWLFHDALRAAGERVVLEPRAVTRHTNFSRLDPFVRAFYVSARGGSAARAASWSLARRVAFAAGTPLLPAVRLWRLLAATSPQQRAAAPFLRMLPLVLLGLAVDAAGQLSGVLRRPEPHGTIWELERERFLHRGDHAVLP